MPVAGFFIFWEFDTTASILAAISTHNSTPLSFPTPASSWGAAGLHQGGLQTASAQLDLKEPYYRMSQPSAYAWGDQQQQHPQAQPTAQQQVSSPGNDKVSDCEEVITLKYHICPIYAKWVTSRRGKLLRSVYLWCMGYTLGLSLFLPPSKASSFVYPIDVVQDY